MFKAIYLQCGAAAITAIVAGAMIGIRGFVSVGVAALAAILPNLFFAIRLTMLKARPDASYAANFFIGEFLKIAATVGILAIAIKGYPEMHWPSLLIGLAIVLHAGFLAFWKKS
ncbi:MAG: ATP synthase subunit I [Azonexaceae bacterium]|uniref:ATP synthase subunit I n=1 Tax=Azonexus sp. R2A61 TaxID=2744443 RepID=UPI001F2C5431|nr:ATP synthase subunit I [Azonexus sp. R2A61]MCE1238858.1 ATP synthase subunit I [Azonexaceae bacterium]